MTFLTNGRRESNVTMLLAPGAGAPADSAWMTQISEFLAAAGLYVVRFDFPYMVQRLATGSRKPPPKAEALRGVYEEAVDEVWRTARPRTLVIGGKSMGGRVASLVAQSLYERGRIAGLACLSYPFHPPKTPEKLRTAHLAALTCPTLIVQGERDPFGSRAEVATYELAPALRVHWARDGDHDLAPRRIAGTTPTENMTEAAQAVARFAEALAPTS